MNFKLAKAHHLRLGKRGEKLAAKLLRSKGYDILCHNYKVKSGEIDIVARDGNMLVFVEVKTRRYKKGVRPATNLRSTQKRRIYRASKSYLRSIYKPDTLFRFDLIEVAVGRFGVRLLYHWPQAFTKTDLKLEIY